MFQFIHKSLRKPTNRHRYFQTKVPREEKFDDVHISFSGAGHLLPYHLGVCSYILDQTSTTNTISSPKIEKSSLRNNIRIVSGSSSGAIAATLFTLLPDRIEEFTSRFIKQRGGGISLLNEMLQGLPDTDIGSSCKNNVQHHLHNHETLFIATTKCNDASLHLFPFSKEKFEKNTYLEKIDYVEKISQCIQASCTIPPTFHPMDILHWNQIPSMRSFFSSSDQPKSNLSYPESEGIEIDGVYYVDGGIASPCPIILNENITTSNDNNPNENDKTEIIIPVSPLSYSQLPPSSSNNESSTVIRISPEDPTFSFFLRDVSVGTSNKMYVRPSIQNIRAMGVSMGANASSEELQRWWQLGKNDARRILILD